LTGTSLASALFGTINQIVTYRTTPVIGEVALLATAIVSASHYASRHYCPLFWTQSMKAITLSGLGGSLVALLGAAAMFALPQMLDLFNLMQLTVFIIMAILTLSLALIWGFAGILCFGQAAFFGLGGYAYALAAPNVDGSFVPVLLSIAVPVAFATVLGYFVFYGRISNVYLGVITLTVSLILFALVNSTAGDQYRIGRAPIGGYNGIPSIPPLHLPGRAADGLGPEGCGTLQWPFCYFRT
jgi:branched-chain amino acid transport system permease protein